MTGWWGGVGLVTVTVAVAVSACGPGGVAAQTHPASASSVASAATVSSGPVVVPTTSVASRTPSTDTGRPVSVTDVPGCGQGGCTVVFTRALPGGGRLDGLSRPLSDGGIGGALAYWVNGTLVDAKGVDGAPFASTGLPEKVACDAGTSRCLVMFGVGAHSEEALALSLDRAGIHVTDTALEVSGGGVLVDLNGDGVTDVALRGNDYTPDYADGSGFWHTELVENGKFVSTGCTAPVRGPTPPPTAPATGTCPH